MIEKKMIKTVDMAATSWHNIFSLRGIWFVSCLFVCGLCYCHIRQAGLTLKIRVGIQC